jgi:lipid-A-disaccharide synthase
VKIFVSAGEVSGDAILGPILAGLRDRFPALESRGLGGEAAARAGLKPLFPISKTALSGVGDVLRAARFCLSMRAGALRALEEMRPDLALLVDYPGLNLGLARRARELGCPVYYVAPPQAWAYRHPARKLRKAERALAGEAVHVLFPFEASDYPFAAKVVTGHFLGEGAPSIPRQQLCLCPGSRLPVLRRNLPAWLRALEAAGILPGGPEAAGLEEVSVLVPPHLEDEALSLSETWRGRFGSLQVTSDKGRALREARWALAFPGTITLELALHGIPAAVAAALDPLTLALGRRLLRETSVGLPNLLLKEKVFPEWTGRKARFGAPEASRLWRGLREKNWNWGALRPRLAEITGPSNGVETAVRECAGILGES